MENIELKNRISNELLISLNLERLKTGESNISWYVYDFAECKYVELDNPSGRITRSSKGELGHMNSITKNRLVNSGWKEQRRINTDLIRKKYYEIGLDYQEVVDKFLKEYGMLNITSEDKYYFDVSFDAIEAIGCNLDGSYFKECLVEYDINERVYPIGEACRKNLLVLMTLTESFYGFTDGILLFFGNSVEEMLDCIVGESRKPIEIE